MINREKLFLLLDQEISGDILLELTLDSLKELNVTTFGKRFKIHSAINVLKKQKVNKRLCLDLDYMSNSNLYL